MDRNLIDYTPAPWWHECVAALVPANRKYLDYMGRPFVTTIRVLRPHYVEISIGVHHYTLTFDYMINGVVGMSRDLDGDDFFPSRWNIGRIRVYHGINPYWRPRPLRHETPESITWTR